MGNLPRAAGPALIPLMTPNETLTRRRDPHRRDSWLIYLDDVHVGSVARAVGTPGAAERWVWFCGFYPGSNPGEQTHGTAASFDQARADFERAWPVFASNRTEADYQGMARAARLDRAEVCAAGPRRAGAVAMKYTADRPFADPDKAARRLMDHARAFEPVQEGRIYIEKINAPFLFGDKGTPAEYAAGLERCDCARLARTA